VYLPKLMLVVPNKGMWNHWCQCYYFQKALYDLATVSSNPTRVCVCINGLFRLQYNKTQHYSLSWRGISNTSSCCGTTIWNSSFYSACYVHSSVVL